MGHDGCCIVYCSGIVAIDITGKRINELIDIVLCEPVVYIIHAGCKPLFHAVSIALIETTAAAPLSCVVLKRGFCKCVIRVDIVHQFIK